MTFTGRFRLLSQNYAKGKQQNASSQATIASVVTGREVRIPVHTDFTTNRQLPLLTLLHSPPFTESPQSWATPALRVLRRPTALPTELATTASIPQTLSARLAQAITLTPEAVA